MRRALPKPGAWMDTLKQVFAFPIYASAAWLLWVLAQQTSPFGLGAALAGAILIALAAWAYQKSKSSSHTARVAALVTAAFAVLLARHIAGALRGCRRGVAQHFRRRRAFRGRVAAVRCRRSGQAHDRRAAVAGEFHRQLVSDLPGQ